MKTTTTIITIGLGLAKALNFCSPASITIDKEHIGAPIMAQKFKIHGVSCYIEIFRGFDNSDSTVYYYVTPGSDELQFSAKTGNLANWDSFTNWDSFYASTLTSK